MVNMTYGEQLAHPKWQRKRLEVLNAAAWTCERCGESEITLHVHHKSYVKGRMAWEYEADEMQCLCRHCHDWHHGKSVPSDTRSAKRTTWGIMLSYHLRACIEAADDVEPTTAGEVEELAKELCASDGLDYEAMELSLLA